MLLKDILALTRVLPCYPHGEGRGYQKLEFPFICLGAAPYGPAVHDPTVVFLLSARWVLSSHVLP